VDRLQPLGEHGAVLERGEVAVDRLVGLAQFRLCGGEFGGVAVWRWWWGGAALRLGDGRSNRSARR